MLIPCRKDNWSHVSSSPTFSTYMDSIYKDALRRAREKGYKVDHKGNVISPYGNKTLKLQNQKGYLKFSFRLSNKIVKLPVHRFVSLMKFGDVVFNSNLETRHLNNNSLDNNWNNISNG